MKDQLLRLAQLAHFVVAGGCLACVGIYLAFKTHKAKSLWVPRYLGMVWPAVGIGIAVLLMRLPTRPLRWLAIGVVLAVNITQEAAIVYENVEPPIDKIAADVWRDQHSTTERTYVDSKLHGFIGPGGGSIFSMIGKYYLSMESGITLPPEQLRSWPRRFDDEPWYIWQAPTANMLIAEIERAPELNRIIVWDQLTGTGSPPETLEGKLPGKWKLVGDVRRSVYTSWWQFRYVIRRREYVSSKKRLKPQINADERGSSKSSYLRGCGSNFPIDGPIGTRIRHR